MPWDDIATGSVSVLLLGFIVVPGLTITRFVIARSYRDLQQTPTAQQQGAPARAARTDTA